MDMKISVGNREILYSGTVTSTNNADVLFTLAESIKVRLKFITEENGSQSLNAEMEEGVLVFSLINFNNPLGTEFSDAFEIGKYEGRPLFLHVRVYAMHDSGNKLVSHTWYLGSIVNNG